MMWFLTAAKVEQQLSALIQDFKQLKPRIDEWQDKASLAIRLGLGGIEMSELINGLSHIYAESCVTLENAKLELNNGNLIPSHGLKIVKAYKSVKKKTLWHLDKLDASDTAGKAAFEKFKAAGYRH